MITKQSPMTVWLAGFATTAAPMMAKPTDNETHLG